ncbi:uncharacterized protein LOC132737438 isoform X2 [Ruditapes philippinarum]|nr:uncharacterized protein LOC132737438 isoform X2 [Ruditapes philippinarum]
MIKSVLLIVMLFTSCHGQWPLGPGFYRGMNQLTTNLNNMSIRLQEMGNRMAREREAKVADDMRRAQEGVTFGNGGKIFITANGGLGYAYNSSDGSFTVYNIDIGSPPRGYMYHAGPHGTSFRSW